MGGDLIVSRMADIALGVLYHAYGVAVRVCMRMCMCMCVSGAGALAGPTVLPCPVAIIN